MKYRIKIKTRKDGKKSYSPQIKRIVWVNIYYNGYTELYTEEDALKCIDKHIGDKIINIEFKEI